MNLILVWPIYGKRNQKGGPINEVEHLIDRVENIVTLNEE